MNIASDAVPDTSRRKLSIAELATGDLLSLVASSEIQVDLSRLFN